MSLFRNRKRVAVLAFVVSLISLSSQAQTDADGDMMAKGLLCTGPMYSHSQWNHYWEGTRKRNNANLGTISTQMFSVMGNWGVSRKLNLLYNIPYVQTHASAGTLHGMKGLQDLSLFAKWRPFRVQKGKQTLSVLGLAGFSTPLTNYTPDFLPMSIGLHSRSLLGRLMVDYRYGNVFATVSGSYIARQNVTIDRNAYYTTEMHYTDKVPMPDAVSTNLRAGFHNKRVVAEAVFTTWTTRGGFDITRNNMPFPSNRMNWTQCGVNLRWIPRVLPNLTVNAGGDYTLSGRNTGQATTVYGGLYYIFHVGCKATSFQFQNN